MKKEFKSELAKEVSRKKGHSKAWAVLVFCACLALSGTFAVTAGLADSNGNQTGDMDGDKDQTQDQTHLQDGSCGDCDGGICPNPDCPYSG